MIIGVGPGNAMLVMVSAVISVLRPVASDSRDELPIGTSAAVPLGATWP
jgi:hypothetical protein